MNKNIKTKVQLDENTKSYSFISRNSSKVKDTEDILFDTGQRVRKFKKDSNNCFKPGKDRFIKNIFKEFQID